MNQFRMLKPEEAARRAKEKVAAFKKEQEIKKAKAKRNPAAAQNPIVEEPKKRLGTEEQEGLNKKLLRVVGIIVIRSDGWNGDEVERLIKAGANVNCRDSEGKTPLDIWGDAEHPVRDVLLKYGAKTGEEMKKLDTELLAAAKEWNAPEIVRLIDAGADVEAKGPLGKTPLMIAATEGNVDVVLALVRNNAEIDATDQYENTALMSACGQGYSNIADILIGRGANVNAWPNGTGTPLVRAAKNEHYELALLLITRGADVNSKNGVGKTALDHAKMDGDRSLFHFLRGNGGKLGVELL